MRMHELKNPTVSSHVPQCLHACTSGSNSEFEEEEEDECSGEVDECSDEEDDACRRLNAESDLGSTELREIGKVRARADADSGRADDDGDGDGGEESVEEIDISKVKDDAVERARRAGFPAGSKRSDRVVGHVMDCLKEAVLLTNPSPMYHQLVGMSAALANDMISEISGLPVGMLVADEMGMGKTAMATMLIWADWIVRKRAGERTTTLIIVPPGPVFEQWVKQLKRHSHVPLASRRARKVHCMRLMTISCANKGSPKKLLTALRANIYDVVLITTTMLQKDICDFFASLPEVHRTIVDEAHKIGKAGTITAATVACIRSRHRMAMTATPMQNHKAELVQILAWICSSDAAGAADKAKALSAIKGDDDFTRKTAGFTIKRTTKELHSMVPIGYRTLHEPMSPEHAQLYAAIKASKLKYLPMMTLMRQLLLDWRIVHEPKMLPECKWVRDNVHLLPPRPSAAEMDRPSQIVQTLMADMLLHKAKREKCIIFTHFDSMVKVLERALDGAEGEDSERLRHMVYTGKQDDAEKSSNLQTFRDYGDVLIANISCSGCGLNLPEANHVYLLSVDFNPFAEMQAIGRVHRLTQKLGVDVVCVNIDDDNLEVAMQRMQVDKIENTRAVLGEDERADSHLRQRNPEGLVVTAQLRALSVLDGGGDGDGEPKARPAARRPAARKSASAAGAQPASPPGPVDSRRSAATTERARGPAAPPGVPAPARGSKRPSQTGAPAPARQVRLRRSPCGSSGDSSASSDDEGERGCAPGARARSAPSTPKSSRAKTQAAKTQAKSPMHSKFVVSPLMATRALVRA